MNKVVLFIFYDSKTGRVLRERRGANHPFYPNLTTFPSGTVEKDEENNLEKTLLREIKEEFNVVPLQYALLTNNPIQGTKDKHNLLYPFLISEWRGTLPDNVIDKGTQLVWETFEEVCASPITSSAIVISLLKKRLRSKPLQYTKVSK